MWTCPDVSGPTTKDTFFSFFFVADVDLSWTVWTINKRQRKGSLQHKGKDIVGLLIGFVSRCCRQRDCWIIDWLCESMLQAKRLLDCWLALWVDAAYTLRQKRHLFLSRHFIHRCSVLQRRGKYPSFWSALCHLHAHNNFSCLVIVTHQSCIHTHTNPDQRVRPMHSTHTHTHTYTHTSTHTHTQAHQVTQDNTHKPRLIGMPHASHIHTHTHYTQTQVKWYAPRITHTHTHTRARTHTHTHISHKPRSSGTPHAFDTWFWTLSSGLRWVHFFMLQRIRSEC